MSGKVNLGSMIKDPRSESVFSTNPMQKQEDHSASDMVLPEDEQKEFEEKMDHYLLKGNNLPKYFH